MYDIDPPSPVLRLTGPQAGTQPTLRTNAQHLAQRDQSNTKPRERIAEGIEAHWARLHTSRQIELNRAINRGLSALTAEIDAL
jgi:hypothetical protein